MAFHLRTAALAGLLVLAALPALAQKRLGACDLMTEKEASQLLRAPIQDFTPNRDFEQAGKATSSWCHFTASNSNVRVQLFEQTDPATAATAARKMTLPQPHVAFTAEKGLGNEGWWWASGDDKARGYIVRKGRYIVVLDVRSEAKMKEADAKKLLSRRIAPVIARVK